MKSPRVPKPGFERVRSLWVEAAIVSVAGIVLALLANLLSPRGIELTRDYFRIPPASAAAPNRPPSGPADVQGSTPPDTSARPDREDSDVAVAERLRDRGLELARLPEVETWFRDPAYELERVVFVDARNRRSYEEGHIPAAYRLDHFYPHETLADVLPAALAAEWVIVYCGGGDCEDSEFAALFLREAGVPADRLRVFAGGLEAWREAGLPIESGARRSGVLQEP